MAKRSDEEMRSEMVAAAEGEAKMEIFKEGTVESHPYAFHVSGPRNVSSPNWRDLINSSWKDSNYKRTVMACFVQAVYLLEIDRQENRTAENALAPKWLIPFKYKLIETLNDERDGSIFGAILEWDRSAALADFVLIRPSGAPRAVLALRGTLLKSQTMRRDIEDDLRFLTWESLKGSVRFNAALKALKSIANKYGSNNVCVVGHSLGAGFALQVGKALAKEGIHIEAHLFNPPSVSLAMSLRNIGEKAGFAWKRFKSSMLPTNTDTETSCNENMPSFRIGLKQWVPHLYINNSDYICCSYTDQDNGLQDRRADKENAKPTNGHFAGAKLFLSSNKGKQKFLEAHGLEQWWSDNLELQMAISNSKLITQQLKSLYTLPASQLTQAKRQ
ncbi:GDSL esterase/lipase At4g10955-like isoform X1 [Nicotiana tabacum]|uniref:GDSL esterase/lipase At4g10955-like isoform X1 n=2 Tax=Nicotiana tabacum TaxID=4097 RepID=A0A1S4BX62_TOBAC|nr:PREDICTED: GDSL esterase/lipase At4g10955-like isoform X1 [Nicotiana tabacum]